MFAVVAAGLLAGGLLAGCSGGKSGTSTNAQASPAASVSLAAPSAATSTGAAPTPAPGGTPTTRAPGSTSTSIPSLPVRPGLSGAAETIVGDLEDGVEPNCVLLRTSSNKLYQLVGGDRSKMKGATTKHVKVDGRVLPAMATTCQQGTPFLVTTIQPG